MTIKMPSLPEETDDEVRCFHPVFHAAAEKAISGLGQNGKIKILHHYAIGSREVDFAFQIISSGKLFLLAEIKRTRASVQSTNYRLQAMNYVTEAGNSCIHPYYLVTNLEILDLFKHNHARPKASQQLIKPSPFICGRFGHTTADDFYATLIASISKSIKIALNDTGEYLLGLSAFQENLESRLADGQSWHRFFVPAAFEYIRGAGTNFKNMKMKVETWSPAENYKDMPLRFAQTALNIDFEGIFQPPSPLKEEHGLYNADMLEELYASGQTRADGEDIASIVGETLASLGPGIVETDDELSRVLNILAASELKTSLGNEDIICDPGSGSGRLLLSAVKYFNLSGPTFLWAIEKEKQFTQALHLRLGLAFGEALSPQNRPRISMQDISDFSETDFSKVKIILMNPPFISGIDSTNERARLAVRIKQITHRQSFCNIGQTGLECVYLELVHSLVKNGTIIAAIMPIRHLSGQGVEAANFRKFLLDKFGLTAIAFYPRKGLFKDVIKQTVIILGVKGSSNENVRFIDIQSPLESLDLDQFQKHLFGATTLSRSVKIMQVQISELKKVRGDGWANLFGVRQTAREWLDNLFHGFHSLEDLATVLKRGGAGNNGASDLAEMRLTGPIASLIDKIPDAWKIAGINNADELKKEIRPENAPRVAIYPPRDTFSQTNRNYPKLLDIASRYKILRPTKTGTQRRAEKSPAEIVESLKASVVFQENSVLITRANRIEAQIGISRCPIVPSTNLVVTEFGSKDEAEVIASFLSSCFAQLEMELLGVPQEGVRKLEKEQIGALKIPNIRAISPAIKAKLFNAFLHDPHLNFKELAPRPTDQLWADILTGGNPELAVKTLNQCMDYLSEISMLRQL